MSFGNDVTETKIHGLLWVNEKRKELSQVTGGNVWVFGLLVFFSLLASGMIIELVQLMQLSMSHVSLMAYGQKWAPNLAYRIIIPSYFEGFKALYRQSHFEKVCVHHNRLCLSILAKCLVRKATIIYMVVLDVCSELRFWRSKVFFLLVLEIVAWVCKYTGCHDKKI